MSYLWVGGVSVNVKVYERHHCEGSCLIGPIDLWVEIKTENLENRVTELELFPDMLTDVNVCLRWFIYYEEQVKRDTGGIREQFT